MSIHGYVGNVITANPTAPTSSVATGVWTTEQQLQAVAAGNWPMALTQISRSLRFNSADSAYLNRTPASASNRKTWTWSGWVKRNIVNTTGQNLFATSNGAGTNTGQLFFNDDWLEFNSYASSAYQWRLITTQVWRDLSAWYHIVVAVDTTQATSSNRIKMYVNGVQITAFTTSTYPSQNIDGTYNLNEPHYIGSQSTTAGYLNGYLTEIYFIDGQALTPSSFGFNSSDTGVWSPKQYTGPYGTNGFYVNFSDNSNTTAATLGKDYSGNGNNWTPNNFSVTAGAGNDSMVDSPTAYGTDTGVGGEVRGNYATLNPLYKGYGGYTATSVTLANGNLDQTGTTTGNNCIATQAITGKIYFEMTVSASSGGSFFPGIINESGSPRYYENNGTYYNGSSSSSYGASFTTNDIIGVAVDNDALSITFYKNGVSQGTKTSAFPAGTWFPFFYTSNTQAIVANFGQRAFAYTAPSGFKALCTTNLPTPTIGATSTTQANDYFNVVLWTGNDASRTITGYGFQPDFIWTKGRNVAAGHRLSDAVRGASGGTMLNLNTASTDAENTDTAITGFASDGFTMNGSNHPNVSPYTYVGWAWNAGGSNATNTSGTITSTVRANTTSGFSIVTYTGTGANATVGHGLGVVPGMIIAKRRSATQNWGVAHSSLTGTQTLYLDLTQGVATGVWNGTPTSTVFNITTDGVVNTNGSTYVAYCFASVAGYSAFGSYTGNGSADGPFVFTGFRPRWVMFKKSSGTSNWGIVDTARDTFNVTDLYLYANLSNAEATGTSTSGPFLDVLSNGFKLRGNSGDINDTSATYIYAAFAEFPFKFSLAR